MVAKLDIKNIPKLKAVYCFTCIVNNKKYIGETFNLQFRLKNHLLGKYSNFRLQKDIKKYGVENFYFEILEVLPNEANKELLLDREAYYKSLYSPKVLYNYRIGKEFSNEAPKVLLQFDLNGNFIKRWDSLTSVGNALDFNLGSVSSAALGKSRSSNNSIWIYEKDFSNELLKQRIEDRQISLFNRKELSRVARYKSLAQKINQFSLEGVFIKSWDSIKSASVSLDIASNNICQCAKNKRKTAGGYKWEYERIT